MQIRGLAMVQQLENNEFILLMYLAGELPAEDRAEIEHMLATDASLRFQFDALRDAQERFTESMARLDAASPPPAEAAAVRRIGRALRQRAAERRAVPAPAEVRHGRHIPWWVYS